VPIFPLTEKALESVAIGEKSGLKLIAPIDYTCMDKVVHWEQTGLDYTFIFFAMKKE
jgi:hypothetical protein